MLKKGIGLDYLKDQILNRKLQVENNTKFSFNRNYQRLSYLEWHFLPFTVQNSWEIENQSIR